MKSPTSAPVQADQACSPTLPGESVSSGPGPHRRVFERLEHLAPYSGAWNELHTMLLRAWVGEDDRMTGLEAHTQRFVARRSNALRVALDGVAKGHRPTGIDWETLYATMDQTSTGAVEDLFENIAEPTTYALHRLARAAALQALLRELSRLSYAQGPAAPAQAPCEAGSHPPPATAATEDPNLSGQGAEAPTADRLPTPAAGGVSSDSASARGGSLTDDREQP